MARVLIYRGDTLEHDFDPGARDWRIGRGTGNDVVLADPSKSVSRFHAELRFEQDQWHLIDLNSQNGSWVDGRRIQKERLSPGTTVLFGEYRLVFEAPPAAEAAAPAVEDGTVPIASRGVPKDTLVSGQAARPPAGRPAPAPAQGAAIPPGRPAAQRATMPAPAAKRAGRAEGSGLVLWLVQHKPILFGGFFVLCLLILVAGRMLRPSPSSPARPNDSPAAQQAATPVRPAVPSPESNQGIIAEHLKRGRAQMDAGNCEGAIREHFARILLIDPAHAETVELKARCEETIARAAASAPTPTATTTPASTATKAKPASTTPRTTTGTRSTRPRPNTAASAANQSRYAAARAALAKGDFVALRAAAQALLEQNPGDQQAQQYLGQAQTGLRQTATTEFGSAQQLEKSGEWSEAVRAYERARDADPSLPGVAAALTNAREKKRQAGEDAYNRARQYHSLGRLPEAIAWYERAVRWLPTDDARHATAVARLAELKRQGP